MPHVRQRLLLPVLLKHLKHFPVVGVIGVRQCGKSLLLREMVTAKLKSQYFSLDSKQVRSRAESAPDAFTDRVDKSLFMIDEIQKVPDLFDSIKFHVDAKRIPGSYLLSGSTQFSKETGIRESLTGRISVLNLYPLTSSEVWGVDSWKFLTKSATSAALSLAHFEMRLQRGGMPGMCFIRDTSVFSRTLDLWLETTCYRDLQQVRGKTLSGDLALQILTHIAQLEEPTAANIANRVHKDARTVVRYLAALEIIRVITRIVPHAGSVGKPVYVLCDTALAHYLGAQEENTLCTFAVHEMLAKIQYADLPRVQLSYFRAPKQLSKQLGFSWPRTRGAPPNLVLSLVNNESPAQRDFAMLKNFRDHMGSPTRAILLTQCKESYQQETCEVHSLRA